MALPTLFRRRPAPGWMEPTEPFGRLMERMFEDWPMEATGEGYPVDISEEDDHIMVDAELPGFRNDEVDVSVQDDLLSIQAERSSEQKGRPHLHERRFTRVQRSFRLPSPVDPDSVDAKLEGGILHMDMKKAESDRTKKIEVK